eukprot:scaffold33078_cov48-Attheya_sp.AAC.2
MMRRVCRQTARCFSAGRSLTMVSLDWGRPKDPPLSLGHASILANLYAHDVEVGQKSWAINDPTFRIENVISYILDQSTPKRDLALGAFVWNENYIKDIIAALRKEGYPGRVILGGPQISYVKHNVEKYYPLVDVFIRGYAEEALAELMLSPKLNPAIRGVHYAGKPSLGLSATADLSKLPSPFLTGLIAPQPFIRWETQRGCPFSCSFCQHKEADPTKKRRAFTPERLQQETAWILESGINDVAVLDPTFNSGRYYLEILRQLAKGQYNGKLSLQCRLEMVTIEFLELVEEINRFGTVVLEFGLQTIHKSEMRIIQRPNNIEKIKRILPDVHGRNIETELSLIYGLPMQTVESFQASIDFCKTNGASKIHAFPLMLLRGTSLHDQKTELGLVESSDIKLQSSSRIYNDIPHVIESPSFSRSQWHKMAEMAEALRHYNEKV